MAKTLQQAADKWAEKTAGKGSKWKRKAMEGSGRYAEGLTKFLGQAPSSTVVSRQRAGVERTSPEQFNSAIADKKEKYKQNLFDGLTKD